MSDYGKLMLGAAAAVEICYIGFFVAMTDGLSLGERSPIFMSMSVIGFLVAIAAVFAASVLVLKPRSRALDEREEWNDVKSELAGGRFLEAGVLMIAALAIFEAASGPNTLGSYSLTRPEALVFALITVCAFASALRISIAIFRDHRL